MIASLGQFMTTVTAQGGAPDGKFGLPFAARLATLMSIVAVLLGL